MAKNPPTLSDQITSDHGGGDRTSVGRTRRTSRSSQSSRRRRRRLALIPTVVSGVAALFVTAAPTGVPAVDAVERAAFVVLVSLAASRGTRISWVWAGGVVAACSGTDLGVTGGTVALITAIASIPARKRSRLVGATVGGAVGLGVMGLSDFDRFGLSLLIGAIAVVPIFVSAARKLAQRDQRRIRSAALVVAGLAAVGIVLIGLAALSARGPLRAGIDESRAGIDEARAGKDVAAAASFERAQASFDEAADRAGAVWALPGRLVPVASQHLGAVHDLAAQAADLAAASEAAVGALGGQDVIVDGSIDLDRIEELAPVSVDLLASFERSVASVDDVDVGWLAAPVAAQIDDLRDELDDSLPAVRNASEALEAAPTLLGADQPRTYLVLGGNPAEARELGGFAGSYGLLRADDGELTFDTVPYGDVKFAVAGTVPELPAETPAPYAAARPQVFVQNWTDWPDFPEVSRVTAALWEDSGLEPVDGTLYTDPATLAALLKFTGPQQLPGTDVTLTAKNATDILLREQYEQFGDLPNSEIRDLLGDAAEVVFDELLDGAIPAPQVLADTLAPLVAQRRLLFTTLDGSAASLLQRTGLDGAMESDAPDLVSVTHSNTRVNKVDAYLQRTVDVRVELDDETTAVRSTVTVTLTNGVQPGLPDVVTGDELGDGLGELDHRLNLSIYTPWALTGVTVDGETISGRTNESPSLNRHGATVVVGGGETITVVFSLLGAIDRADDYELEIVPNATAVPDIVSASVTWSDGIRVQEPSETTGSVRLSGDP